MKWNNPSGSNEAITNYEDEDNEDYEDDDDSGEGRTSHGQMVLVSQALVHESNFIPVGLHCCRNLKVL